MRWQILINEYEPKIVHIDGTKNSAADYISRMFSITEQQTLYSKIGDIFNRIKGKELIKLDIIKDFVRKIHNRFGHSGSYKLYKTLIDLHLFKLRELCIDVVKRCKKCQFNKDYTKFGKVIGKLSGKEKLETVSS